MEKPFRQYMLIQIQRINLDKWYEGERINTDPGVEFILKWIRENGAEFKRLWEKSLCKSCIHCNECGFEVKEKCDRYGQVAE